MVRMQIRLTEERARRLKEIAGRRGVSIADLVRQGVDAILDRDTEASREELVLRAIAATERHRSSCRDVAESHDEQLADAYAR